MYLILGVGPPRNLNYHVQYSLFLVMVEWDVVEWRHGRLVVGSLKIYAVVLGVWPPMVPHRIFAVSGCLTVHLEVCLWSRDGMVETF